MWAPKAVHAARGAGQAFGQFQYPTPPLRADAETKRKAIENAYQPLTPDALPDWTSDTALIGWLDSLAR
jgi:hypothetical protein